MPLLNILTDIAKERGATSTVAERAVRVADVNAAALEIHNSTDVPEAMDEDVFDINVTTQQVALPSYVDKIRGHRYFDSRLAVDVDDGRNRYNYLNCGENELWYQQWRKKRTTALQRLINNQSILKFSIPLANGEPFSLDIVGQTDKSHRIIETVNFSATDIEKITAFNWKDVESITKSLLTKYNITVKDVEDNVLAIILNSEYISSYIVYQIADTEGFTLPTNTAGVEIIFKRKFQPFKNNKDTFHGTDIYDKAIFWKYMEHNSRDAEDAASYQIKCRQILTQLIDTEEAGIRRKIKFSQVAYWYLPYCQERY